MKSEEELIGKFHLWLAEQSEPPSILDVTATGDRELMAAFVLEGFREAAREAVLKRVEREAIQISEPSETGATAAIFRVFHGLSRSWLLTETEQLRLLGLQNASDLQGLRAMPMQLVPTGVIERVAILLDIFKAINTLLPQPTAADAWVRKPNLAPMFSGRSALDLMLGGLDGLRDVRSYLRAQVCAT